jgi:hypothetical protein
MTRKSTIHKTRISAALAEQAARVLIHKYALLPSCTRDCLVGSLKSPVKPGEKNWASHSDGLSARKEAIEQR